MRMLDQLMRFGVIWDFLWIHTASYQLLMIPSPSGMLPMRPLLPLLMLLFRVLVAKLVLLVAVLLLSLAVPLRGQEIFDEDEETEEDAPLDYREHPDSAEDEDTSEDAAQDEDDE